MKLPSGSGWGYVWGYGWGYGWGWGEYPYDLMLTTRLITT